MAAVRGGGRLARLGEFSMEAETARRAGEVSSTGLLAVLEFVERPAAVVEGSGRIVGFNEGFREFISRKGLTSVDRLSAALDPESCERVDLLGGRGGGAARRDRLQLKFKDGASAPAHVQVLAAADGKLLTLLVIDVAGTDRAAASLRHDIAGPLTAILGAAELLLIRGGNLPAEAREKLSAILKSCERIAEILHRRQAEDDSAGGFSP
jgi:signal transduction histidine kinase